MLIRKMLGKFFDQILSFLYLVFLHQYLHYLEIDILNKTSNTKQFPLALSQLSYIQMRIFIQRANKFE